MKGALLLLVLAAAPARAQAVVTAYIDNDVAGDVQSGRLGVGLSAAYFLFGGRVGVEADAEAHGHFFRDADVAADQPDGVDLNTSALLATGNIVVPYCLHNAAAGTWCPYALAGLGVIDARFTGHSHTAGVDSFERTQDNLAFDAGAGVMHALTRWVGFRVDVRYLHAFVDETSTTGGYFKDYGYWRASVGVTFTFPARER